MTSLKKQIRRKEALLRARKRRLSLQEQRAKSRLAEGVERVWAMLDPRGQREEEELRRHEEWANEELNAWASIHLD